MMISIIRLLLLSSIAVLPHSCYHVHGYHVHDFRFTPIRRSSSLLEIRRTRTSSLTTIRTTDRTIKTTSRSSRKSIILGNSPNDNNNKNHNENDENINTLSTRRQLLWGFGIKTIGLTTISLSSWLSPAYGSNEPSSSGSIDSMTELVVNQTPSGLKYIDLQIGTGTSPQYGNLCCISYKAYIKLAKTLKDPNPVPIQYDQIRDNDGYVIKHGNGRMILGLDEGIHTMKVGGIRRLLIPPKLGFTDLGLGPIPMYPWQRSQLNHLLDEMVQIGAGTIIYEVKLLSAIPDEADQGYYQDTSPTPEEFDILRENLRLKGLQQRQEQQ